MLPPLLFPEWKKGKNELLSLVYNKSSFHVFKTKNVENVESRNYQRLFKIENVEENVEEVIVDQGVVLGQIEPIIVHSKNKDKADKSSAA